MVVGEGALHALLVTMQRRSEDTSFALAMVAVLQQISQIAEAARVLAHDNTVQVLSMLMRTHTHSLSLIRGCCAVVGNLCVDDECSRIVALPVLFGAISTSMWLHAKDTSMLLAACATLAKVRVDDSHNSPPSQGIAAIASAIRQRTSSAAAASDAESTDVVAPACATLANLCRSEACRLVVASEGGIITLWQAR